MKKLVAIAVAACLMLGIPTAAQAAPMTSEVASSVEVVGVAEVSSLTEAVEVATAETVIAKVASPIIGTAVLLVDKAVVKMACRWVTKAPVWPWYKCLGGIFGAGPFLPDQCKSKRIYVC